MKNLKDRITKYAEEFVGLLNFLTVFLTHFLNIVTLHRLYFEKIAQRMEQTAK